MSLVTPTHRHLLQKIERMTKSRMTEGVVPTRKTIGTKKISQMISQFTDQDAYQRALELMDDSWKSAIAGKSPEEVAARFIALMYPFVFSEKERPQMERTGAPAAPVPSHNKGRKEEYRGQKRTFKRDFKKQFVKPFAAKKKFGGDAPPRRRPAD